MQYFNDVTLLVTHYNRSESLERLLSSFKDLGLKFGGIVVSDDGSQQQHLQKLLLLRDEYQFELITTPSNKGLGNNINKGQKAVRTEFTLYIQEDFIPKLSFTNALIDATEIMRKEKQWDLISFYAYMPYPYKVTYKPGLSEKKFKWFPWYCNHLKFYVYSDHPHLRRSDFLNKFGDYKEGVNGDQTEMAMALSFIKNRGKALVYEDIYGLLDQKNTSSEPSTATFRRQWRQSDAWMVRFIRRIYLFFKLLKLTWRLLILKPTISEKP